VNQGLIHYTIQNIVKVQLASHFRPSLTVGLSVCSVEMKS